MRKLTMIKKIRITNHNERFVRDTTIGKVYDATFHKKGTENAWGALSLEDTLCFRDDVGGKVSIWTCDDVYEVVEEEPTSETKEDDWNTVNWDEIPEDVEAVITFRDVEPSYYKVVDGTLLVQPCRVGGYGESIFSTIEALIPSYEDRCHLRPTPTTQPTPEPPESTQVESSEVEAATTPEFDWGGVDDDVEAVVLYLDDHPDFYKYIGGKLHVQFNRGDKYSRSDCDTICDLSEDYDEGRVLIRPVTETPTHSEPPSIHTILQEAQQAILEHHGVTGKVKFTVECSE
jgi:hypothetical protein